MEALIIYTVFAITTGICSWLFYYRPVLQEARELRVDNSFTRSPILSSFVYMIISTLIAPMVFIPLFNPMQGMAFIAALRREMLKQD
jgi:hypothetical protein